MWVEWWWWWGGGGWQWDHFTCIDWHLSTVSYCWFLFFCDNPLLGRQYNMQTDRVRSWQRQLFSHTIRNNIPNNKKSHQLRRSDQQYIMIDIHIIHVYCLNKHLQMISLMYNTKVVIANKCWYLHMYICTRIVLFRMYCIVFGLNRFFWLY